MISIHPSIYSFIVVCYSIFPFISAKSCIITVQPASCKLIAPGRSASFGVTAKGKKLSYQWQKDGTDISGANTPNLTILTVAESDEGDYSCVISDATCSVTSAAAALTVCKYVVQ